MLLLLALVLLTFDVVLLILLDELDTAAAVDVVATALFRKLWLALAPVVPLEVVLVANEAVEATMAEEEELLTTGV